MEKKENDSQLLSQVPSWIIFFAGLLAAIIFYLGGTVMGWITCDFEWRNNEAKQATESACFR